MIAVVAASVLASTMSDMSPKVYLHTFPPSPYVYSMSPFSLKVESWLRLHGIDYECVYCMEFGPKGQIPYVLVGDEVSAHAVHMQCTFSAHAHAVCMCSGSS